MNREDIQQHDLTKVKAILEHYENLQKQSNFNDFDRWFLYQFLNVPQNKSDLLLTTIGIKSDNYIDEKFHYFKRGKNGRIIKSELHPDFYKYIQGRDKLLDFTGDIAGFNVYITWNKQRLNLACGDQLFRRLRGNEAFEAYKKGQLTAIEYLNKVQSFGHGLNTHQNRYTY